MNNVQLFSIPKSRNRKLFIKRNAGCLLFTFGLAFTTCMYLVISLSVDFQDRGKVKFIFVFIFVNLNQCKLYLYIHEIFTL